MKFMPFIKLRRQSPAGRGRLFTHLALWLCGMILSAAPGAKAAVAPDITTSSQYLMQRWTVADGLPESKVVGVTQTPDGYLWCVTINHLVRFDGRKFETVADERATTDLRRMGSFWGCATDAGGAIWVWGSRAAGCWNGIQWQIFNGTRQFLALVRAEEGRNWFNSIRGLVRIENGSAQSYPCYPQRTGSALTYSAASRPEQNEIWLARGHALYRFQDGKYQPVETPMEPELNKVICTGPRRLWLGCGQRIAWRETGAWNFLPRLGTLPGDGICRLYESRDGTLWVGTRREVFCWREGRWETMARENPGFPLQIRNIIEDAAGTVWMGCDGGLLSFKKRIIQALGEGPIQSAWERRDGELWIASQRDLVTTRPLRQRPLDGLGLPGRMLITVMLRDQKDRLWIGTQGDGLFRIEKGITTHIPPATNITALCEDPRGRIWIGCWSGLMLYDRQLQDLRMNYAERTGNKITMLWRDTNGAIWAGRQSHGLVRVDPDQTSQTLGWPGTDLPGGEIYDMLRDTQGTLWIAGSGGLARWGMDGSRVILTAEEGLADNVVRQLASDRQGALWLGTRAGIQRIPIADLDRVASGARRRFGGIVLGRDVGITEPACLGGFRSDFTQTNRDVLWFPTAAGLVRIEPARISAEIQPPVYVYLNSIWTRGRLLHEFQGILPGAAGHAVDPIELSVRTRPIEIRFDAAAPGRSEPPKFTCRMTNLEEEWSAISGEQSISYPALPAGHYKFEVRIPPECGGTHQTRAAIDLIVKPVFWQTAWFYTLALLASSALAAGIVRGVLRRRYRRRMQALRREQALDQERARIARDMHDQIGAGLTSLAMVSDLAQNGEDYPPEANDQFNRIFHLARELTGSLDEIVWAVNPANDTLESLVAYLVGMATEQLEGAALHLRIDTIDALPAMNLSSRVRHEICMTLREALANIIKHAHAREVTLSVQWTQGEFTVAVSDDGQGFNPESVTALAPGHDGLRNMRTRMESLGGRLAIQSRPGQGTRVVLSLKMMIPEAREPVLP